MRPSADGSGVSGMIEPEDFGRATAGRLMETRRGMDEGVAVMPQATRTRTLPRVTLNSDGQPHRLENGLAIFTLIAGLVTFALGFVVRLHVFVSAFGLATLLIGLYAQMISATRAERVIIVTGLIAGFVGFALGLGHGGF